MSRIALATTGLAALGLAVGGCYPDRLTSHFDTAFELTNTDDDSAILDETARTEEDEARIRKRLMELEMEEEPVYHMNAGDEIEIRVYDHQDLGMLTKIGPDGMVGFAFMGQVKLSGLTIAEGAEAIHNGLKDYVRNPVVSITVKTVHSETATISGLCAHPGVYPVSNATRLADLYAMAGASAARLFNGVAVDAADLDHSYIIRNGAILPVDFHLAIEKGDRLNNIRIRKGDYVFIAQRMEASVTICGEVKNPHKRLYEPGMGLIETLTSAGWMLDTHWKHVIIIRDGLVHPKMYKVNVDGILAGKCRNINLKSGDIVYVPKDDISEYNVFVRKLLPTAQLINLITSRVTAFSSN
ncbi:MAG: polysaccharide biosynthesis/export family protein [Kiritimatiellae bacterium]|nr:polysaccharide biosynthesis/export family protein [Kiritimatiellia bacterium]